MAAAQGFALITPASRGIGFSFTQQLLSRTQLPVVATARTNCDELRDKLLSSNGLPSNAEKRLKLFQVDVKGMYGPASISTLTISPLAPVCTKTTRRIHNLLNGQFPPKRIPRNTPPTRPHNPRNSPRRKNTLPNQRRQCLGKFPS